VTASDATTPTGITVMRGRPAPGELAAVLAVLLGRAASASAAVTAARGQPRSRSGWADRSHALGASPRPSPQAWRATARPR
jgi:hypothetical protein